VTAAVAVQDVDVLDGIEQMLLRVRAVHVGDSRIKT
jgi:hypothetical protein